MSISLGSRTGVQHGQTASKLIAAHPFPPSLQTARRSEQVEEEKRAIKRQLGRKWIPGDVYAPHDLSAAETRKWKQRRRPTSDIFDQLNINPLSLYKNFTVMSDFMTDMGRIKHSKLTGLRPVNQRKVAKAIRRAISLGLMPSIHKHPEVLKRTESANIVNGSTRQATSRRY
ncbi:uncharacterized protein A1O9_11722 [Exophiala aquamarina CBS 119918]|uniref:Small ribosomal subunit protein bS18m n=1 Tax=Exophiala aquamarina CBS 119918 TaxID=1182545 RepID=A0A072NWW2_9EURO|nr:uncharacterized protein A1O9_11722 [Exophiala aquamarina CBS 119918]KEF52096.1 hypothetical protein A1O9_11722 [Exophiala aquamarina CBS 119918]